MSINNKPIVVLVYLQHAGWFFPPVWKMELLEYSEMLPKNKPQRQQAGGCRGQGKEVTAS